MQYQSIAPACTPTSFVSTQTHVMQKVKYPQHCLIGMALMSSATGDMQVGEIYNFIETIYPCAVTSSPRTWKNSLRHSLSLSGYFEKANLDGLVVDAVTAAKKNNRWRIKPEKVLDLVHKVEKFKGKSSSPSSCPVLNTGLVSTPTQPPLVNSPLSSPPVLTTGTVSDSSVTLLPQSQLAELKQFLTSQLQVVNQMQAAYLSSPAQPPVVDPQLFVQPQMDLTGSTSSQQYTISNDSLPNIASSDIDSSVLDFNLDNLLSPAQDHITLSECLLPADNTSLLSPPGRNESIPNGCDENSPVSMDEVTNLSISSDHEELELPEIDFDVSEFLNDQADEDLKAVANIDVSALLDNIFQLDNGTSTSSKDGLPQTDETTQDDLSKTDKLFSSQTFNEITNSQLDIPLDESEIPDTDISDLLGQWLEDVETDNVPIVMATSIDAQPLAPAQSNPHLGNDSDMFDDVDLPENIVEILEDLLTQESPDDDSNTIDPSLTQSPNPSSPVGMSVEEGPSNVSTQVSKNRSSPDLSSLQKFKLGSSTPQRAGKPRSMFYQMRANTTQPILGKKRARVDDEDSCDLEAKRLKRMNNATNLRKAMVSMSSSLQRKCKKTITVSKPTICAADVSRKRPCPFDEDNPSPKKQDCSFTSTLVTPTRLCIHKN